MVLIFVNCVDGTHLSFDVRMKNTVRAFKRQIQSVKDISPNRQRLIFGGRILKDDDTLETYNLQKECRVQLFPIGKSIATGTISPSSIRELPAPPMDLSVDVPESLRFGDLILVQLIQGRDLKKSDFWTGSSDPYAILAIESHSAKSKIVKRNLNPDWNELFMFTTHDHAETNADTSVLSILIFDYNTFTPDDFLGSVELSIENIRTETILDLWLPLNHIETGEIHLKLRRFSLASPTHLKFANKLAAMERSIRMSDLQSFGISLQQLVGEEAWVASNASNPALEHLVSVLLTENIEWTTTSLNRIESILAGQHILPTRGVPTRYVWFGGLMFSGTAGTSDSAGSAVSPFTKESLLRLIEKYAVPKCCFIPVTDQLLSFALVEFKSVKEALLLFLLLQHKRIGNQRLVLGFGHLMDFSAPEMHQIQIAGFLNIFEPERTEWNLCWCLVRNSSLLCFSNMQSDEPSSTFDLQNSVICNRGPTSIEMFSPTTHQSCFCYTRNRFHMAEWLKILTGACQGEQIPSPDHTHEISVTCSRCSEPTSLAMAFVGDYQSVPSCRVCLRTEILSLLEIEDTKSITELYSIIDLVSLLARNDFDLYLELSLRHLLESADSFISCPKCDTQWEFVLGKADDAPDFSRELGINGRLLDEDGQRHYLSHRTCCRDCETGFCRECKAIPYHSGFNCEVFEVYKNAEKCRFCSLSLMPNTISVDPPSEALRNVCNSALCLSKRDDSCLRTLECGHMCNGIRGEETCPSCLNEDCSGRTIYTTQSVNDDCNICFTDRLSETPCVQLDCGHFFHAECIKKRLQEKWVAPSVSFGCSRCPLCSLKVAHPSLTEYLEPIQKVHRDLENNAHFQLKEEGMQSSPELSDPSNPFYLNPVGFAMSKFAFYQCFVCQAPYYGGLQQCMDGLQQVRAEDFICPACSGIGLESCAIHGREYMVYKCRFCCSVATYFCWGTTHFCLNCHMRQENHDYVTTKPRDQLPKCEGPHTCDLRVEHPPNGEEFSLGCSLCRGKEAFGTTAQD